MEIATLTDSDVVSTEITDYDATTNDTMTQEVSMTTVMNMTVPALLDNMTLATDHEALLSDRYQTTAAVAMVTNTTERNITEVGITNGFNATTDAMVTNATDRLAGTTSLFNDTTVAMAPDEAFSRMQIWFIVLGAIILAVIVLMFFNCLIKYGGELKKIAGFSTKKKTSDKERRVRREQAVVKDTDKDHPHHSTQTHVLLSSTIIQAGVGGKRAGGKAVNQAETYNQKSARGVARYEHPV